MASGLAGFVFGYVVGWYIAFGYVEKYARSFIAYVKMINSN
jgi:hypothetical protein